MNVYMPPVPLSKRTMLRLNLLLVLLLGTAARAGIFVPLYSENWDSGDANGWNVVSGDGNPTLNRATSGGYPSGSTGYLNLYSDAGTQVLFGNDQRSGDHSEFPDLQARFAMKVTNVTDYSYLSLFFYSDDGNSRWSYNLLDLVSDADWLPVTVRFDGNDWTHDLGGDPVFTHALTNIYRIGFEATRWPSQLGGEAGNTMLDNWEFGYEVPEPGQICVLGVALLSLGLTFRRRVASGLSFFFPGTN